MCKNTLPLSSMHFTDAYWSRVVRQGPTSTSPTSEAAKLCRPAMRPPRSLVAELPCSSPPAVEVAHC
jgi:hypothetical protein